MAYLCFINSHLLVSSHGRTGEWALCGLFYQGTNPIHEGSTLMTQIISQRPHLQSPSFFRSGFQHMNFEGTQTFSLRHNPSHNSTIKCLAKGGTKESPQKRLLKDNEQDTVKPPSTQCHTVPWTGQVAWDIPGNRNTSRNTQMGPIQTGNFPQWMKLLIKTKRPPTEWEKIFANDMFLKIYIGVSLIWPFLQFMRFSQQVYWGGLPFPSPVDHVLSELFCYEPSVLGGSARHGS